MLSARAIARPVCVLTMLLATRSGLVIRGLLALPRGFGATVGHVDRTRRKVLFVVTEATAGAGSTIGVIAKARKPSDIGRLYEELFGSVPAKAR